MPELSLACLRLVAELLVTALLPRVVPSVTGLKGGYYLGKGCYVGGGYRFDESSSVEWPVHTLVACCKLTTARHGFHLTH